MSRPSTRSSGKFGQNTRHSSKKSRSLKNKNHVTTIEGFPQIRKSVSRNYIHESNSSTSRSKRTLSVPLSKRKGLSYEFSGIIDVPKPSRYFLRSQSECILETPMHQFKQNMMVKQFQDEFPVNKRNFITENEQSISTDLKRKTRSSMGERDDRNMIKNRSHESSLAISPLPKSTVKQIKSKTIQIKSEYASKRLPRSSVGKVARKTKNVKIPVNSKRVAPSTFCNIADFTPTMKKMPKSDILIPSCPLSAPVRLKKSEKEETQKDSKKTESSTLEDAVPSWHSAKYESEKQPQQARDAPCVAAMRRKSVRSTSVNLMRNTKQTDSGSLPARELPKRYKNSTASKGQKRKSVGSPQEVKNKKNATLKTPVADEDNIPLDCLSMGSTNQRSRRHTINPCIKNNKASNLSTIQQKAKKTSTTKIKTKLSNPRKNNGTLTQLKSFSAPNMSQLTIDCLSKFESGTKSNKKRPKSAPAAIKRKSKIAGLTTPIPKKGTLKRKRWMFNALKEKNEGYEDDIFENQKFQTPAFRIFTEEEDESDSSIKTPKFGFLLTPSLPKKTPTFKETISSADLLIARKNAEAYLYRRNKKKTIGTSTLTSPSQAGVTREAMHEKKKLEFSEVLAKVETIRKDLEEKIEDESDKDDYFTDAIC